MIKRVHVQINTMVWKYNEMNIEIINASQMMMVLM
jgi:hypothetical protein